MANKDFQNGFALGLASGGVIVEQGANPELVDEIYALVGKASPYKVLWSAYLSGFTFNEDAEGYTAPYTGELPNFEIGPYKLKANDEIVDGWLEKEEDPEISQVVIVLKTYSQNMGQFIYLAFGYIEGQVIYLAEGVNEVPDLEIKILKTDEAVADYIVNLSESGLSVDILPTSYGFTEGAFDITFATDDGSVSWIVPNNPVFSIDEYSNMLEFYRYMPSPPDELMNALNNNTPVTVTISQGDVTKVITDSYVAMDTVYIWGNLGLQN